MLDNIKDTIKDLKIVVIQEGDNIVAQCLDYDIAVQASADEGLEVLKSRFAKMLAGFIIAAKESGTKPFEYLKEAPGYFWKLWMTKDKAPDMQLVHVDLTDEEAFLSSQNIQAEATFLAPSGV